MRTSPHRGGGGRQRTRGADETTAPPQRRGEAPDGCMPEGKVRQHCGGAAIDRLGAADRGLLPPLRCTSFLGERRARPNSFPFARGGGGEARAGRGPQGPARAGSLSVPNQLPRIPDSRRPKDGIQTRRREVARLPTDSPPQQSHHAITPTVRGRSRERHIKLGSAVPKGRKT